MTMIGLKSKSDEVYIVFIDTEEKKSAEIKLKDFQPLWRALKREAFEIDRIELKNLSQ